MIVLASAAICIVGAVNQAAWLSDENGFLGDFVGTSLITLIGVLVTIGLSIAGNLHLELTRIDNLRPERVFDEARQDLKHTASGLAAMLFLSVVVAVSKVQLILWMPERGEHIANSAALLIVVIVFLLVVDVTSAYFEYGPTQGKSPQV